MKHLGLLLFFLLFMWSIRAQEPELYFSAIEYDTIVTSISETSLNTHFQVSPFQEKELNIFENDPYIIMPYSFLRNTPNWKRLGNNSIIVGGLAVSTMVALYFAPESFTNWKRDELTFDKILGKWYKNVSGGLVIDHDDLFLNWVAHPYCGALYYMTARSAGFNAPLSFSYSFIMSTFFWEMGIESLAERPSLQDVIITPVVGSIVGELFYIAKRKIVAHNYKVGHTFVGHTITFLLDPLNEIMDCIQKTWHKTPNNVSWVGCYQPVLTSKGDLGINFSLRLNF